MLGSVVKIQWHRKNGEWKPVLLLAVHDGFEDMTISEGDELDLELTDQRRCTGFSSGIGEREPCPEYRRLDSGSQCAECRNRDVYSEYVQGRGSVNQEYIDTLFSVYLAQLGRKVKVGVTRSEKIERRWVEQGAEKAAELVRGVSSEEALDLENQISTKYSISETVNKSSKTEFGESEVLEDELEKISKRMSIEQPSIVEVCTEINICSEFYCREFVRSGRLPGQVGSVKGQIISGNGLCVAMGSGRVIKQAEQNSLQDF